MNPPIPEISMKLSPSLDYPGFFMVERDTTYFGVTVEAGFLTNGLSVPRLLRVFTYSPFHPKCIEAAALHDYMYFKRMDRKKSDKCLYDVLIARKVNKISAKILYHGIRLTGWYRYRQLKD